MSSDWYGSRQSRRAALARRIDRACDAFERQRTKGQPADLRAHLQAFPLADHRHVFEELLSLEIGLLRDEQCSIDVTDYVARYHPNERIVRRVFSREFHSSVTVSLGLVQALRGLTSLHLGDPLLQLRQLSVKKTFAPGETLIEQGAVADSLIMLLEGRAEIHMRDAQGHQHVLDTKRGTGTLRASGVERGTGTLRASGVVYFLQRKGAVRTSHQPY